MTLYKKKYRVETTRLAGHHYANGTYFVTICTKKKLQWFGGIVDKKMMHSELGKAAKKCVISIPEHFPHVFLYSFCVMPDHVHILLCIGSPRLEVETQNFASLQNSTASHDTKKESNLFGPQSKNLGSIIRGMKIGVTKFANDLSLPFDWQPRYHDRIIRSEKELATFKKYITLNPDAWDKETIPWHADAVAFSL